MRSQRGLSGYDPAFAREGVRRGLEQIKWLPAAEGMEGTLLGFGIQDRGAPPGRYLVLRQWLGGKSVKVQRLFIDSIV